MNTATSTMNRMFAANPAVDLMDRLSYAKKIRVVGLVSSVAILILTMQLFFSLAGQIERARLERAGVYLIQPLRNVLEPLQQHRGLTNAYLSGTAEYREEYGSSLRPLIESRGRAVDAALDAADRAFGQRLPQRAQDSHWMALRLEWDKLQHEIDHLSAAEALERHHRLVAGLNETISRVADATHLSVDPYVGTYYLAQLVTNHLPTAIEQMAKIRDIGVGIYANKEMLRDDKNLLISLNAMSAAAMISAGNTLNDKVLASMPELKQNLAATTASFKQAAESIDTFTQFKLLSKLFDVTPQAFFAGMTYRDAAMLDSFHVDAKSLTLDSGQSIQPGPIATVYRTLDDYIRVLDSTLESRQWSLYRQLTLNLLVAGLALIVVIYMLWIMYVAFPVRQLISATDRIADGDFDIQLDEVERTDEIGQLSRAFNSMAQSVKQMRDTLEMRVADRTAALESKNKLLRQKTLDIRSMLQNMPQGILTVIEDGAIHSEYSAYLEAILETQDIAGGAFMQRIFGGADLGADSLSQIETAIASCIGQDSMNFEFNAHLLVGEFHKTMPDGRVKTLELGWSPICNDDDIVEKLMVCVRDVTELRQLAAEASLQKRELEIIGQILAVKHESFHEFVAAAESLLDENEHLIAQTVSRDEQVVAVLFRNMHTIKGNARTYGLLHLTNKVHEAEQAYDELRKNVDTVWRPDALRAQLDEVRTLLREYAHINEVKLGRKGPGRRGNVEKYLMVEKQPFETSLRCLSEVDKEDSAAMRNAIAEAHRWLNRIGSERFSDVIAGVVDSLPSLARELGKEIPEIIIDEGDIRIIRNQISGLLKNVFMHLLRNALDHGLETPAARRAAGKRAMGLIHLELELHENRLWLSLRDDGRGLAMKRIRQKALEQGLIGNFDPSSDREVAQLIFAAGFSTAEKLSEVSGRGVGMDAVKKFLERENGSIEIRLLDDCDGAEYRAFEMVIALPDKFVTIDSE